jgi:hypothetical protein
MEYKNAKEILSNTVVESNSESALDVLEKLISICGINTISSYVSNRMLDDIHDKTDVFDFMRKYL